MGRRLLTAECEEETLQLLLECLTELCCFNRLNLFYARAQTLSFSKCNFLSFNKFVVDKSPHCGFPDIETHRLITEHYPPRLHTINGVIESRAAAGRFCTTSNYMLLWKRRRDYGRVAEVV